MIQHTQKSTKEKGFWQPVFVGDVLQATSFWRRGAEISIPETDLSGMLDGDRIYIENDADPLHLITPVAGTPDPYTPLSGDRQSSPGAMIWKEGGDIHHIYHEEE